MRLTARILAMSLLVGAIPARAGFIEDWRFEVGVDRDDTNPSSQFSIHEQVEQPFHASQLVEFLGSVASSQYDFDWNSGGGTFDISASLDLAGTNTGIANAVSSGFIFIRPSVPLIVSGAGTLDYSLSADPMFSAVSLSVSRVSPFMQLGGDSESYDTIGGVQSASFAIAMNDVTLPANDLYAIGFGFRTQALASTAGSRATATGSAHFEITALPEPATLWLLAIGCFAIRRRDRFHSQREDSAAMDSAEPAILSAV